MFDPNKVDPRLAAQFIARARRAAAMGSPEGSTSEQIVAALLNGRCDWLPPELQHPLKAIARLHADNPEWFHTMIAVGTRGANPNAVEMVIDRLP